MQYVIPHIKKSPPVQSLFSSPPQSSPRVVSPKSRAAPPSSNSSAKSKTPPVGTSSFSPFLAPRLLLLAWFFVLNLPAQFPDHPAVTPIWHHRRIHVLTPVSPFLLFFLSSPLLFFLHRSPSFVDDQNRKHVSIRVRVFPPLTLSLPTIYSPPPRDPPPAILFTTANDGADVAA
ncbi:hypothetical protein HDV62DRAFT_372086 [Trichoderma sp. SZMC 28011]